MSEPNEPNLPPEEPGAESPSKPEAEPEKDQLQQLKEQVAEFKDKYLRGLADSENLRKRLQKERQELVQYAVQGAIVDFLSPIDHLESALKFADQASPEVKHWAVGFQMILGQFKEALTSNGVERFSSVGEPFDPHRHEAVEMIETNDHAPGTVVEESLCGYKMGDKTLRPARVKVAKNISEETAEASAEVKESENL